MGPLVPDLISENLNYVLALFIGIAFGAILEQAGFSSSRRLVGLFYGYDFTVLRVFFTAGIVAMVGVMALDHFGLLDMNLVYINPTFLWSAIVGGLIMGLGFVIGGYCPGTSFCAAAIGKLDALALVGGALVGVLIFAEGYPLFEGLYKASNLGSPRISQTLGISPSLFALVMILFALAAFTVASYVERKVNGRPAPLLRWTPSRAWVLAAGVVLAISAFSFTDRKADLLRLVQDEELVRSYPVETMSVDEFAFRLMDKDDDRIQVIDFRPEAEIAQQRLPKSYTFTVDNLFEQEPSRLLRVKGKINVFVANDELTERKMAVIARELGFQRVQILEGGLDAFREQVLNFQPSRPAQNMMEEFTYRFRTKAKSVIPELIQQSQPSEPVKGEKKRIRGGC
ncbi:MAG: YeeE/YedE thiosulfate transporter family protein [Armatimonadota bacterium]|nr:YeeE/YedE thiosulfate transporter family protein [Armatimonadota bacterium]